MKLKFLLFAFIGTLLVSCSTAYKSTQTPDDVYYSPVKFEENKDEDKKNDEDQVNQQNTEDRRVRQTIRDRRWRDFDDYDYTYNNSPYNHCYCSCPNYGYYYNPYYYPSPIYNTTVVKSTPPRKVNLASYQGYSPTKATNPKTGVVYSNPNATAPKYNNSNKKPNFFQKVAKAITNSGDSESSNTRSSNNSSGSSNTRTYSPSSSSSSSSGSSSSSSGSVTRPTRGGK